MEKSVNLYTDINIEFAHLKSKSTVKWYITKTFHIENDILQSNIMSKE